MARTESYARPAFMEKKMILERIDRGLIQSTVADVFYCFWRAELWPRFTDHVVKIEMLDEQDGYQRYAMQVNVENKHYVMETQRISVAPRSISFQQPKPPVFMNSHSGVWTFEEGGSATMVSVAHRMDVNEQKAIETLGVASAEDARQKIMGNLERNGMAMINSVNEFLQSKEGRAILKEKLAS
jgi:polyketide cyclase/dehydrase/lipid transport protein